jgi:hypothetical protein
MIRQIFASKKKEGKSIPQLLEKKFNKARDPVLGISMVTENQADLILQTNSPFSRLKGLATGKTKGDNPSPDRKYSGNFSALIYRGKDFGAKVHKLLQNEFRPKGATKEQTRYGLPDRLNTKQEKPPSDNSLSPKKQDKTAIVPLKDHNNTIKRKSIVSFLVI